MQIISLPQWRNSSFRVKLLQHVQVFANFTEPGTNGHIKSKFSRKWYNSWKKYSKILMKFTINEGHRLGQEEKTFSKSAFT